MSLSEVIVHFKLLFSLSHFILGVYAFGYVVGVHICVYVYLEARGQSQFSFFRGHPLVLEMGSLTGLEHCQEG